jgi:hypothetical protein
LVGVKAKAAGAGIECLNALLAAQIQMADALPAVVDAQY